MSITKEKKSELIQAYKVSENDNGGSVESQVAVLTERIRNFEDQNHHNKSDHAWTAHGAHGVDHLTDNACRQSERQYS